MTEPNADRAATALVTTALQQWRGEATDADLDETLRLTVVDDINAIAETGQGAGQRMLLYAFEVAKASALLTAAALAKVEEVTGVPAAYTLQAVAQDAEQRRSAT